MEFCFTTPVYGALSLWQVAQAVPLTSACPLAPMLQPVTAVAKLPVVVLVLEWHDSHAIFPTGTWFVVDSVTKVGAL